MMNQKFLPHNNNPRHKKARGVSPLGPGLLSSYFDFCPYVTPPSYAYIKAYFTPFCQQTIRRNKEQFGTIRTTSCVYDQGYVLYLMKYGLSRRNKVLIVF